MAAPSPKLTPASTSGTNSRSQNTANRLNAFIPSIASDESPVTIYLPAALNGGAGNELSAADTEGSSGTWTCPAGITQVQVECYGGGGGGGGGSTTAGGGGGGGGEYACEENYPVVPGQEYTWTAGAGGTGGVSGQPGTTGGTTVFDTAGLGLSGGVVANGGLGGDSSATGIGGAGGSGSTNSIEEPGGSGGTNASGVWSDNPIDVSDLHFWYKLKDVRGSGRLADYSGNANTGTVTQGTSGEVLQGVVSPPAPPQVPETDTNVIAFSGTHAGYCTGNGTSQSGHTAMTISVWVRTLNNTFYGQSAQTAIIAANCGNGSPGWRLGINGFVPYFQLTTNGSTVTASITANTGKLSTGRWHYIVGTFDGTTITIYVDGVSAVSKTSFSGWPIGTGAYNPHIGVDPTNVGGTTQFNGYMSNIWQAWSAVSASFVTTAYGSTAPTGGAGGGASGGSAAAGNAGSAGSGTVGGSAGAAANPATANPGNLTGYVNTGSAAGGTGGDDGDSGNAPAASAPYAGGGGGAGAGSPPSGSVQTYTVTGQASASYCGPDATGGNAGALFSIGTAVPSGMPVNPNAPVPMVSALMFQGSQGGSPQLGTMNSLLLLPSGIKATLKDQTIQYISLTMYWQPPANFTGANLLLGYADYTALPASWTGTGITSLASLPVTASAASSTSFTFDLSRTNLGSALQAGTATALTFGAGENPGGAAYNGANASSYSLVLYGANAATPLAMTNPVLTITYTGESGVNGGNGGAGCIVITYVSPDGWPIGTVQPEATTDAGGNAFASGFTGQISAFNPADNPATPETWHAMPAFSTGYSRSNPPPEYKLYPDNTVGFAGVVSVGSPSNSDTEMVAAFGSAPYYPVNTKRAIVATSSTSYPYAQVTIGTTGELQLSDPANYDSEFIYLDNIRYPLDY